MLAFHYWWWLAWIYLTFSTNVCTILVFIYILEESLIKSFNFSGFFECMLSLYTPSYEISLLKSYSLLDSLKSFRIVTGFHLTNQVRLRVNHSSRCSHKSSSARIVFTKADLVQSWKNYNLLQSTHFWVDQMYVLEFVILISAWCIGFECFHNGSFSP